MSKKTAAAKAKIDKIINDIPNDPLGKYNNLSVRRSASSRRRKRKE